MKKGFTLIELLVILTILVTIASLIFVFLGPAKEKGRDSRGETDLRQMLSAFELKYDDNDFYPDLPDSATVIPSGDTRLYPYLSPTPYTNGLRNYYWYDDGDNKKFCVYFQEEIDATKYFYISHKGLGYNDSPACPDF